MSEPVGEVVSFLPETHVRSRVSQRFEQMKGEIAHVIPAADIQHVGGTAIPGFLTKGDLDIQVRVATATYLLARQRLSEIYAVNGFTE